MFDESFDIPLNVRLPSNLTHSSCEVLEQCPMHFFISYRWGLPLEPPEIDYGLAGRIIHRTILRSFKEMKKTDLHTIIDPHSFIEETVITALEKIIGSKITDSKVLEDVELCLKNYIDFMFKRFNILAKLVSLDAFLPTGCEVRYKAEVSSVPFLGDVDVIFQDTALRLADWKSSNKTSVTDNQLRQAARYVLLYKYVNNIQAKDFYIINLREPVELLNSRIIIADSMLEAEERNLQRLWKIACGTFFEKRQSADNCFFCNHKNQCKYIPPIIDLNYDW